ncbi:MAG TPA: HEAT repeat domain-containing protein [Ktedonobacteraceae bacterium]|nr:HEAT repeat domain-containing protein [Ktedonobacteraceae bacterium]
MMTPFDSSSKTPATTSNDALPQEQVQADVAPPVGITPPQVLARDAAAGRRGAAWRLLYWIMENDPRAVVAVSSLDDDRLAQNLLEFIAVGTWAGKPFVVPVPLRSAYARTRLRTLFLPEAGMDYGRAERVLLSRVHDKQPAMRETVAYILGIVGSPAATPAMIEALRDPVPAVRLQAAKALGRTGSAAAVPALLGALQGADDQLGSQIFSALIKLGPLAVPALVQESKGGSAWKRWQCVRALGDIHDLRALPVLVKALEDSDHSVAWMGAKSLVHFGKSGIRPVLETLISASMTPWLAETASYVLNSRMQRDSAMKPYLEPLVQRMRESGFRVGTSVAARKALDQLVADGLIE